MFFFLEDLKRKVEIFIAVILVTGYPFVRNPFLTGYLYFFNIQVLLLEHKAIKCLFIEIDYSIW